MSLARQFGLSHIIVIGVTALSLFAVGLQLSQIQRDADVLLEETREAGLSTRLLAVIEESWQDLASLRDAGELNRTSLEQQALELEQVQRLVEELLDGGEADPSREEHESAEHEEMEDLLESLAGVARALRENPDDEALSVSLGQLALARSAAHSLLEETLEESERAKLDVEERAKRASLLLLVASLLTGSVLFATAVLGFRRVIQPLRVLRDGARRFGLGHLEYRIAVEGRDEIGALGRTFNDMAGQLAAAQQELEAKVEARTRELIRASRMADLGVLAAGVAHEINNPLASIVICSESLARRRQEGEVDEEREARYLDTIQAEAYRAKEITGRLLELARQDSDEAVVVELAGIVGQAMKIATPLLQHAGLVLEKTAAPAGLRVHGVPGDLLQVLLNLIWNARDASPPRGTVRVGFRAQGTRALVSVTDEGDGVAEEDLERVFEPFFTKKEPGSGTGLGLALAGAIADRHKGALRVENLEAGGACFVLELPLYKDHD